MVLASPPRFRSEALALLFCRTDPLLRLAQEAKVIKAFYNILNCSDCIFREFPARNHDFATPKQEEYDFWIVHPVDEARELFGFLLDVFQPKSDCKRIQIEVVAEVCT